MIVQPALETHRRPPARRGALLAQIRNEKGITMFEGFSGATVDFMWGIRFNNEKSWFEAHKEEYLTHFRRSMRRVIW